MIDSYIFGFLLSKINVNLFITSGPITVPIRLKKAQESCFYIDAWSAPGVRAGTRALIKHGEITALEDSIAAPQKARYQPFAKNQN